MGFDMGAFHKRCAKSHLGAAEEHAELAKCHHRLANKSTSDDDHAASQHATSGLPIIMQTLRMKAQWLQRTSAELTPMMTPRASTA